MIISRAIIATYFFASSWWIIRIISQLMLKTISTQSIHKLNKLPSIIRKIVSEKNISKKTFFPSKYLVELVLICTKYKSTLICKHSSSICHFHLTLVFLSGNGCSIDWAVETVWSKPFLSNKANRRKKKLLYQITKSQQGLLPSIV